ncbi:hypothetical protein ACFL2W_00485, partial [Candidatus Omnitrophota bacterium]
LLVTLLFQFTSYAASCYGTKMPDKFKWFWGTEVNYIFERNLEGNHGKFRSAQCFLTGTFGITDWLCFDGAVGWGFVKYNPSIIEEIDYDSGFAGKYGFRIKLLDRDEIPFKSVFGFQHISVHPEDNIINGVEREVIFDDWQFSLIVSYDGMDKFVPYVGGKVSRGDLIEWYDDQRKRRKSEGSESVGVVCGFNLFLTDDLWLTLEGRFLDEDAASFSTTYAF